MESRLITKENLESYFTHFEGKYKRFTREFESDIQEFESRKEVEDWFSDLFGEDFILQDVFSVGDKRCWNYTVIHDRDEWTKGQEILKQQGYLSGGDYMWSYQIVQVFEDGSIHIVY